MASKLSLYLAEKKQKGELTDTFCESVGISSQRIELFLSGQHGATIKEENNVAKYFNIPVSTISDRRKPQLSITKQCAYCSEHFIPSNTRAIFCSDACRNKDFRANK